MRKPHQCVVCGFNSKNGVQINGHFMCKSCEKKMLADEERQYEDEDWAEVNRLENEGFQIYTIVS